MRLGPPACTHQGKSRLVVRADGARGIQCPMCGLYAFEGDSLWTALKSAIRMWRGIPPKLPPGTVVVGMER